MPIRSVIKPSAYFDSVTLMLVQRDVRQLPGIEEAGAVMGTDANKELLRDAGLLTPEAEAARPDDLILAVRATSNEAAVAAGDGGDRNVPPQNGRDGRSRTGGRQPGAHLSAGPFRGGSGQRGAGRRAARDAVQRQRAPGR